MRFYGGVHGLHAGGRQRMELAAPACAGPAGTCCGHRSRIIRLPQPNPGLPGPENTPYCGGCFLFDIYFPPDYPRIAPKVEIRTTGGGSVRVRIQSLQGL